MADFIWGPGGTVRTPEEAARLRAVAAAIASSNRTPKDLGEGISRVGDAVLYRSNLDRADKADEAGFAHASDLMAGLGDSPDRNALIGALSDPYVAGDAGKSAVVQALLGQSLKQSDPEYALDRQYKEAQLAALQAKPAMTAPSVQEFYDENTGLPYKAQWNPATGQYERVGGTKALSNTGLQVVTAPDGTTTVTQGAIPKLTEGQSKDTVYITRATGALPTVNALGDKLTSLGEDMASKVPYGGYLQSEDYQKASNAGKEFLSAILRKDTGAAITQSEMDQYGSVYLPQPGDKPGMLAQKKAARDRAVKAIALGLPPQAVLSLETQGVDIPALPGAAPSAGSDAASTVPPKPGDVLDGYRYKGGDPADPNSWEPAQ